MDLAAVIGLFSSFVTIEEAGRCWRLIVKDKLKKKEVDINNWDSDDPLVQACLDRFKTDMGDKYKDHIFSEEEIEEIIPHRHPFLLIDYIEDYKPGEYAVGYKCVTFREDFFRGHFPQEPVMPGVLTIEALAQVGAVAILSQEGFKGKTAFFGGINKCRFKGKVVPGDKLKLETKIIKQKGPMGIGQAIASVDGKVVAKAELTFMVGE